MSGGASAVKEPGHFQVRKSSSRVTGMHFFLKTQAANAVLPSKSVPAPPAKYELNGVQGNLYDVKDCVWTYFVQKVRL